MDASPESYIGRLLEISTKKSELLKNMLTLTQAQTQSIKDETMEALNKQVAEKQVIIDKINQLDEEFNVYFQRLKQVLKIKSLDEIGTPSIKGTKELQETVKQITDSVNEILKIEQQNNTNAKNLLSLFGNELQKLSKGKKANSAYFPAPLRAPSYYIDKKK